MSRSSLACSFSLSACSFSSRSRSLTAIPSEVEGRPDVFLSPRSLVNVGRWWLCSLFSGFSDLRKCQRIPKLDHGQNLHRQPWHWLSCLAQGPREGVAEKAETIRRFPLIRASLLAVSPHRRDVVALLRLSCFTRRDGCTLLRCPACAVLDGASLLLDRCGF